jgi:FkbM family methyltransferase
MPSLRNSARQAILNRQPSQALDVRDQLVQALTQMRRIAFTGWETVLIVVFTALVTAHVASATRRETGPVWLVDPEWSQRFNARYGAEHFSAGLEEYIVRDFFNDHRGGVFLDVGAYRAKEGNNTYRLERDFGWSGLAIDANEAVASEYKARPNTRFIAAFVGDEDRGTATLYVPAEDSGTASGERQFTEQFGTIAGTTTVPKRSLNSLLAEHGIEHVDFLSMDIELSEPAALRGFDIMRYRPKLVCIEAHAPVRDAILEYFARHEYVLVGKYLAADALNYWFRPLPPASSIP